MRVFKVMIFSLLAGLFLASNAFALNAPAMQGGNPDNWYIEVEWNDTVTGEHGNGAEWDLASQSSETFGVTVKRCDTADAENFAGWIPSGDDVSHAMREPVSDGDTLLIQIRGHHQDLPTDGNVVEGQSIEPIVASGLGVAGDGDGFGFAFETDSADTGSPSGFSADCWVDFDKGTN